MGIKLINMNRFLFFLIREQHCYISVFHGNASTHPHPPTHPLSHPHPPTHSFAPPTSTSSQSLSASGNNKS